MWKVSKVNNETGDVSLLSVQKTKDAATRIKQRMNNYYESRGFSLVIEEVQDK